MIIEKLDNEGAFDLKVDASSDIFKNYRSGIIQTSLCGSNPLHTVKVVGYGWEPAQNTEYLLIQNSWKGWGSNGLGKISMDMKVAGKDGVCGIYASL